MAIYTRFGTPCKLVMPIDIDSSVCGIECYYTTGTIYRECNVIDLKADDGFREINAASCDLEQRYANLVYILGNYLRNHVNTLEHYKGLFMLLGFDGNVWGFNDGILSVIDFKTVQYHLALKGFIWNDKFSSWMYKEDIR